jgi:hypothetical protein
MEIPADDDHRGVGGRFVLRSGSPVAEIVRLAEQVKADRVHIAGDVSGYARNREAGLRAGLGSRLCVPAVLPAMDRGGSAFIVRGTFSNYLAPVAFGTLPRVVCDGAFPGGETEARRPPASAPATRPPIVDLADARARFLSARQHGLYGAYTNS